MEAFKLVVRREGQGPDGKAYREWRFRHDKPQEFFIAQIFQEKIRHAGHKRYASNQQERRKSPAP